jgi:hypothetical protein
MAQAILNRAVSGNWTKIPFGPNSGQIFSNVVTQPRTHNRDVALRDRASPRNNPCGEVDGRYE